MLAYNRSNLTSLEIPATHIQTGKQMRQIAQPTGDDVSHTTLVFGSSVDLHQLRIEQLLSLALAKVSPDHHVYHSMLVLKGYEYHATSGRWFLPARYQPCHRDVPTMLNIEQLV